MSIDTKTGDFFVANELQGYLMQSKRILGDTLDIPNYLQTETWSEEANFDHSEWDDARLFIDGIIRQSKVNFAEFSLIGDC